MNKRSMIGAIAALSVSGIVALISGSIRRKKEVIGYNSGPVKAPIGPENCRKAIVANCLACEGIEAANPATLAMFEEILGEPPNGVIAWRELLKKPYGQGGISTCALFAEGIYRRVGCDLEDLRKPYIVPMALSRFLVYARRKGALMKPDGVSLPKRGDYVVIGDASTNSLHVLIPIQDVTDRCVSVDGGQVGPSGLQAIYRVERSASPTMIGKRPIYQWVDAEKVGYLGSGLVPEGWKGV